MDLVKESRERREDSLYTPDQPLGRLDLILIVVVLVLCDTNLKLQLELDLRLDHNSPPYFAHTSRPFLKQWMTMGRLLLNLITAKTSIDQILTSFLPMTFPVFPIKLSCLVIFLLNLFHIYLSDNNFHPCLVFQEHTHIISLYLRRMNGIT